MKIRFLYLEGNVYGKSSGFIDRYYSSDYPSNSESEFYIEVRPGKTIDIAFAKFSVESVYLCSDVSLTFDEYINGKYNKIEQIDGQYDTETRMCDINATLPLSFTTTSNSVRIKFKSYTSKLTNLEGFKLTYAEVGATLVSGMM